MSHKPAAGGRQCACWRRLSVTLGFTGQLRDGTGLLFSHARSYDPALGRFTSADSIAPEREDPQTRNRYSDGRNNPLRYTDPSGHCGLLCIPAAVAAYFTAEVLAYVVATFVVVSFVTAVISCSQDAGCSAVLPEFADQLNQGAIGVREFLGGIQQSLARKADIKFIDNLARDYNLTREQRRELHDDITGKHYSEEEIEEIAKEIADRDGNNYQPRRRQ